MKSTIEGKTYEVIYYGTSYENAANYGANHFHPLEYFVKKGEGISSRLHELWARALYVTEQSIHREDLEEFQTTQDETKKRMSK